MKKNHLLCEIFFFLALERKMNKCTFKQLSARAVLMNIFGTNIKVQEVVKTSTIYTAITVELNLEAAQMLLIGISLV